MEHVYIAIDLKSFYASVECQKLGFDPLTKYLVVADASRTEKTICLAVSPALKEYGIPGRARLFEVIQKVKEINAKRIKQAPRYQFQGKVDDAKDLKKHPECELSFFIAPPRMALYLEISRQIYEVYLKYISPEDIHVYSIDEVFIDATNYLNTYQMTPQQLAKTLIQDVYKTTGITATAGIASNLYLCKVAMDIMAKHVEPDKDGCRIAMLDVMTYREKLWNHQPITDFWRVGRGYAKKLASVGLYTMGDIAKCSVGKPYDHYNEDLLYDMFGVNAELLIDHAWGYEPCTMKDIKAYKPSQNSIGSGQVLSCAYEYEKFKIVLKEMLESLALTLVDKGLVTDQIVLSVDYDIVNVTQGNYHGEMKTDRYGRQIPKQAHGTVRLKKYTSSTKLITSACMQWIEKNVNKKLFIKRINLSANHVVSEISLIKQPPVQQLDLFTDYEALQKQEAKEEKELEKEKRLQQATLAIQKKFGKNSVIKGRDLEEGATTIERNHTIGGHKA